MMNWWIAIAILAPSFMVCGYTSWLYDAKAMSAAHPGVGVIFGGNIDNNQYHRMLASKEATVVYFQAKYRLFVAGSVVLAAGISTCMFNAPAPKIN
jgi:hypothetical protein